MVKPRRPVLIRTADVLENVGTEPTRHCHIAGAIGVNPRSISGHLSWLVTVGYVKHTRVRGYYAITPRGEAYLAAVRLRAAA